MDTCGSITKWNVGNKMRTLLLANSALTQYISSKIFPLVAPEKTEGDFIIYLRDSYRKELTKMGVYEDEVGVYIVVVCQNYDNAIAIASLVDDTLTGKHTIDGNVFNFILADSTETFDDGKYIETILYKIK